MSKVSVKWLGTAGLYITDNDSSFMIDPFFSRYGLLPIALKLPLKPKIKQINSALKMFNITKCDGILVSHSHFDHSFDVPEISKKFQCNIFGARSTAMIARGANITENFIQEIEYNDTISIGNFKINFLESVHGPALFNKIPYPGIINSPLKQPANASAYRLGKVFSMHITHSDGTNFVHHGSAGYKDNMYDNINTDTIFLGIAGRGDTDNYIKNTVLKVKAKTLIPVHYDYFFKPVNKKMSYIPGVDFKGFQNNVLKYQKNFTLKIVKFGEECF